MNKVQKALVLRRMNALLALEQEPEEMARMRLLTNEQFAEEMRILRLKIVRKVIRE